MDIQAGSTNQTVSFAAYTTATGAAVTVTSATAGLSLWYRRGSVGAKTAISPSDLATLATAHADGGILVIEGAEHRLDLPDAAVAAGVDRIEWGGTATDITIDGGTANLIGQATTAKVQDTAQTADHTAAIAAIPTTAMRGTDNAALAATTATAANQTTILARLGTWTGSGVNTVLGAFKALLSKDASAPSDIGGTFAPADDSTEAIRDRGDASWLTGAGATAAAIWAYATRTLTQSAASVTAAVTGSTITVYQGTQWTFSLTVGSLDNAEAIYFGVKEKATDPDDESILMILESVPGGDSDGLQAFNKTTSVTAGDASLAITDSPTGAITITVSGSAGTNKVRLSDSYVYAVKVIESTEPRLVSTGGTFRVQEGTIDYMS